ncbi:uncharacterized protein LOC107264621 isoform X2 [Cephus cinctus]|uniref:Uncharacterized protein LOC107264621 isoform X2 n=1 Tax=Cephus cinctus TaxID=211228 RepID=A0AAJ7VYD3_CEPCN|nr:uncharacterized protein LOC107264621 isoform X2 [Cephus cinctus]
MPGGCTPPAMDLVFLLVLALLRQDVVALQLLHVNVPPYAIKGDSAPLLCSYDLGTGKLYSVTWYKDHEEFYRYVPKATPSQHSYRVEGVEVDTHFSNDQKVTLHNVGLKTGGLYKCEVITEAPGFPSVYNESYMEVISPPDHDPEITGKEKIYASGDIVDFNCTSGKSYPPAKLEWYINGEKIAADSEMTIEQHDLFTSISTLRLEIGPNHLVDGKINVRCDAIVELNRRRHKALVDVRGTQFSVQGLASLSGPSLLTIVANLLLRRLLVVA